MFWKRKKRTGKAFALSPDQMKPLVRDDMGACFATDMIMVEGLPVRLMYRTEPADEMDSGWQFLSGFEDAAYMADATNIGIYTVNQVANYDPSIIPYLETPPDCGFQKPPDEDEYRYCRAETCTDLDRAFE